MKRMGGFVSPQDHAILRGNDFEGTCRDSYCIGSQEADFVYTMIVEKMSDPGGIRNAI